MASIALSTSTLAPARVNPWVIAFTVTLATFMEVLDTSIANVALPHIAGNLSAGVDESTWVLTSYLVSNAIVLPLSGWFSALIGRKRFYLLCVVLFTVSSVLCGLAPSLGWLVFFRVLQGLGGGGLQPTEQAILVDTFPGKNRPLAMAAYGVAVVVAPIVGPTLGGWITDHYSWRWIFFINVPIGLISLFLTSQLISDPPTLKRVRFSEARIDYGGLGLIAVGLGFLQVMLDKGQREDWFQSHFIVFCTVVWVAALAGAVYWELRRAREPVVELRLFRERNLLLATFVMFMLGFVLYSSTMLLPLYLQTLMGYSATASGMALSPGGVAILVTLPFVGLLLTRFQARWMIVIGLVLTSLGLFMMAEFSLQTDFRAAVWARVIQGFGLAFLFVPINSAAFDFVPADKTNQATGLINLARNIGAGVGIAFVTTLLERRIQFHRGILAQHLTPFDRDAGEMASGLTSWLNRQGADPTLAAEQAQRVLDGMVQKHATMLAFVDNFWILGVLFLCVIPVVLLMKQPVERKDHGLAVH